MATPAKSKEIQVQKPAQSLQAFQKKLNAGEDLQTGILKPILMTAGGVLVASFAVFGYMAYRSSRIERYESNLAQLMQEVNGDDGMPVPPAEMEKRMRERLPRLQALVKGAPGARRDAAKAALATWQLELDGKADLAPAAHDGPWSSLREAQRLIALGKGKEAANVLASLRRSADPGEAWANLYWTTLLDADRLMGNREQAWKDFADYKARFREKADTDAMERTISGI